MTAEICIDNNLSNFKRQSLDPSTQLGMTGSGNSFDIVPTYCVLCFVETVKSDLIRGNVDTIILKCLNVSEMYGLEIINYIRNASSDTYILKQPTLYSALKRLEAKKYITSYWQDSAIGGRRH